MSTNLALWDKLGKTDPAHTKKFKRAGGFEGTAIKPMFSYRRMTEEFGPCGVGWGILKPSFDVVPAGDEVLVYCTVAVWHGTRDQTAFGVGGDKVLGKNKHGLSSDDEAFKKAFTDAVTNALKMIGVGADVHMGMFDDNKYVNTINHEFREAEQVAEKSSAQLKREGEWERVSAQIEADMVDVHTFAAFERLKDSYRQEARTKGWNKTFTAQLADLFLKCEEDLQSRIETENDVAAIQSQFPGARVADVRRIEEMSVLEAGE